MIKMLCNVLEDKKIIILYLSRSERDDKELRESLLPKYKEWHDAGYKVAVMLSGDEDLVENTIRLLRYNKWLSARNQVRKEVKKAREMGILEDYYKSIYDENSPYQEMIAKILSEEKRNGSKGERK